MVLTQPAQVPTLKPTGAFGKQELGQKDRLEMGKTKGKAVTDQRTLVKNEEGWKGKDPIYLTVKTG